MSMRRSLAALALLLALVPASLAAPPDRERARQLANQGNWKEALEQFRTLAHDPATDAVRVPEDLQWAANALNNLGKQVEWDDLLEKAVAAHPKNPRLLRTAAQLYRNAQHNGTIVAGKFERGPHRGGTAKYVDVLERDRVRGLQLYQQGLATLPDIDDRSYMAQYYLEYADAFLQGRHGHDAWELQDLTDLAKLPDPEDGQQYYYGYYGNPSRGAPVDTDGNAVFHALPEGWEKARSDGERWRWLLKQTAGLEGHANSVKARLADFALQQFGVQTMAEYGQLFGRSADDDKKDESGPFALRSLGEDETIARLASGIRRFKLPADYDFIKAYRELAVSDSSANYKLGEVFENRQQYVKAAECFEKSGHTDRVKRIRGNYGTFEGAPTQASGAGAVVDFRYRNGKKVAFTAHRIEMDRLIADMQEYLKSDPGQFDHERVDLAQIGWRLVQGKQAQYKGEQVAEWSLDLEPRAEHLDRRITVTTPLSKGGAYLVTAKMEGGNSNTIVLWVADLAIVKKQLDQKTLYYVVDARSGQPASGAKLSFFGYRVEWKDSWFRGQQRAVTHTERAHGTADDSGQLLIAQDKLPSNYQWLVQATDAGGRTGWLGWTYQSSGSWYDQQFNQQRMFFLTDRPVYRPGHTVKFKFWSNVAQYDREGRSPQAGQSASVRIYSPKGEAIALPKQLTLDDYGGADSEWTIPAEATLGPWRIEISGYGQGTFRVEEYKKPEFEVNVDAPSDPVMLGEKFEAKIQAKYLFGAPVKEGKFKYKVTRTRHDATWYPPAPWDWYYGKGYWWFACDYLWYPGWHLWGCRRPIFGWMMHGGWHGWAPPKPPEVVAENEGEIGADGTVKVSIDTALAKATQSDSDHKYDITAEVTDQSRRTITGTGSVLVARRAFKVYAWVDRGHFRVGDSIEAHFHAQTVDSKPVAGAGALKLLKLSYDENGKPVETEVQKWDLPSGADGTARQQFKASEPGQYRLSYTVTDAKAHAIEGGYVFAVGGEGLADGDFRFNDLELVADKKQYAPGEKLSLRVNANRRDTTVLLFVRAANGVCLPPRVVKLKGKSAVEEIQIEKKDMPNFFIEALTVSDARVHQEMLEVVVPPEDRVLDVKVEASAPTVKPGEKAKVSVQLTAPNGEPYVGSLAIAMYDKAVEYIAGGPVAGDIREVFWKWRRNHHPQRETNVDLAGHAMAPSGEETMQVLGVFGNLVAEEMEGGASVTRSKGGGGGRRRNGAMQMMKSEARGMVAPAPAAPGGAAMEMSMAAPSVADKADMDERAAAEPAPQGQDAGEAPAAAPVQPTIRQNFADTAFWAGAIETDKTGKATIEVAMPENLTTWKTRVWAMGSGARCGQGETQVITTKNLLIRLQAPRFFVETDEVVLSANVHNYLKSKKSVQAVLELEGGTLAPVAGVATTQTIEVEAGGEKRVDWRVKATREGKAIVRMKALSDEESDAMQMEFPVLVHGFLKVESFCGVLRPEQQAGTFKMKVPDKRKPEQSRLEIRYSPTLALAMVDALPYMVEYPYGCTEQTLNRFLPTALTQKVLIKMGVDLKDIQGKITNLNAQEIGDDQKRSEDWKRLASTRRWNGIEWVDRNPVYDEAEVRKMIKTGVDRLTGMQCSDGGWGWFSGTEEHSSAHTTAVVVHGLQIARFADVALPGGMLERGVQWLAAYEVGELRRLNLPKDDHNHKTHADALDAFVAMVLADAKTGSAEMRDRIYADRNHLPVYSKCMLGLAMHKANDTEKRDMLIRNVEQFLVQDEENQTAYLKLPEDNYWWYWYGSEYEAHACYLKLLAAAQPKSEKASRMVKYLLNNRRNATYWNSTRDTAYVIEAFADYIVATGEDKPELELEIVIDGKTAKTVKIDADNLFTFDNKLVLTGDAVTAGEHTVEIKKKGKGPLYWNAYLTNFTLEDRITKAGLEVKIERAYYKLVREEATVKDRGDRGQVLEQKVEKYRREPIADLATLKSGDLVEVELVVDSKNDYEYIMLEDAKAAGFEPVEVRSGYNGNDMGAYVEFRDQKVCFFVRALARGKHSVSYRLRAEIPGTFSALPARAAAMYAPELRGNSDEFKVGIQD
jgi:uncharacterized protein YfaS (alpha-2-macroglobulin family)